MAMPLKRAGAEARPRDTPLDDDGRGKSLELPRKKAAYVPKIQRWTA
jgi:hypothetical protein